jgi:hypothetical protein
MPSSTSSSRELRRCLLLFAGSFTLCLAVSAAAWQLPVLDDHKVLEAVSERAPDGYFQVSATGLFGQHAYYHEMAPVREPLRAAEVLVLGNSRTQVAFAHETLDGFFREHGLRYYLLGFADSRVEFIRVLFEKYELKPQLVIVNADWFFVPGVSHWAEAAMQDSYFDSWKRRFEMHASSEARRWIHRLLPHPAGLDVDGAPALVYRSVQRGDWLTSWNLARPTNVHWLDASTTVAQAEVDNALAFKRQLHGLGARMVLTWIPSRIDGRRWVRELAERIDVPVIVPNVRDLQTIDGSHLDPESARRFVEAFLQELPPYLP